MNAHRKNTSSSRRSKPDEALGQCLPASFKLLCLGLLLVLVVPGLFKLGRGLSRPPAEVDASESQQIVSHADVSAQRENGARSSRSRRFSGNDRPSDFIARPSGPTHGDMDSIAPDVLKRLEDVIASAGKREQQTAAALKQFLASGAMAELRNLNRQDVVALADHLAGHFSPDEMGALLQQSLGQSADTLLIADNVSSSLLDLYDAVAGNPVREVRPSALMVTDAADEDGRITGEAHVLPSGTQRVYAVFENDHALEGLDQVLAVWRNPDDDRMVFTEFEPVRQGSAYNYVWLDVESGWPQGRYQVELFHPEAQSLLLASESFSVR